VRKHAAWSRWQSPVTEAEFEALATGDIDKRLFDGAPFNGNGLAPCDDRCVVGTVTATIRDIDVPGVTGSALRRERAVLSGWP
jgi:hypothetical protein